MVAIKKNPSKKKFLVTGGTGFIGSALVKRLVDLGHSVRVFDNNLRGAESKLGLYAKKVELVIADIRDPKKIEDACKGVDCAIHLAYLNGTEYFYTMPELVLDIGVKGMINIIDGCIKHKVPEIILASSSEVYQSPQKIPTDESVPLIVPDPLNPRYSYGGGKIISELLTINFGRKHFKRALIFRPHNVYGPDMGFEHVLPQFITRAKELKKSTAQKNGKVQKIDFKIQGSGEETRSFIYIDDFIDGLMKVIEKGEHLNIYHIGTMEEKSIKDVAKMVGNVMDLELSIIPGELTKGSTKRRCPDNAKLKSIGFSQKISFLDGLKKTIEWYLAHEPPKKSLLKKP